MCEKFRTLVDNVREIRRIALIVAAQDVCPICDGRVRGKPRTGPNVSGNYCHGTTRCIASPIWARIAKEAKP